MRNYEVVFIVHPDLDETALTALVEKVKAWISDSGGSVEKADVWGKRRMAYRIRKQRDGQYDYMVASFAPTFNAELERNLIIERVRAGLRRARLEGRILGRRPIEIDRMGLLRDRDRGQSLAQLAKTYKISRTSVARALKRSEGIMPGSPLPIASTDTEANSHKHEDRAL